MIVAGALAGACGGVESPASAIEIRFGQRAVVDPADLAVLHVVLHPPSRTCDDLRATPTVRGIFEEKVDLDAGAPASGAINFDRLPDGEYRVIGFAGPSRADVRAYGCASELVRAEAGVLGQVSLTLDEP